MVNDPAGLSGTDLLRHAAALDLADAFAAAPEAGRTAAARASRPLPPCPAGPITEPAACFDAGAFTATP